MSNEYSVKTDGGGASICLGENCDYMVAFIDIYIDDDDINSPFKTVDDAEMFANIIVKLLKVVT